jgi:hypothetical protein
MDNAVKSLGSLLLTNIIRSKVNPEAREMLLGHSIGLSDSYYRPDANEILQEYLTAVITCYR